MSTTPYPPARDPEKIPAHSFEEPDYYEPIEDPDSGELPEDDPDDEEEDDVPEDDPLRALFPEVASKDWRFPVFANQ
jgi:hypothetical protein